MKKVMAVYDEDPRYAERLSDYVNRKDKGIFSAMAFTSKEKLDEYMKNHEIDLLLTGEEKEPDGEMAALPSKKIYLTEDPKNREGSVREIYKYQSGDDIIREVMAAYSELPEAADFTGARKKGKRLVGVYSPVNRCGKTTLALAVGQTIAKEEKTLFVSLDSFTGFSGLLNERWKRDLSDLIYYYKQGRYNSLRLNSIVFYLGDLAWLPPIRFPEDFNQISSEDLMEMMMHILEDSSFETLVLDIGDYGKQIIPFLERCQIIYMPVKEDVFSRAKMDEFSDYLDAVGKKELKDKFCQVHVPVMTGVRRMEHFPQELLWGDMGDFVRNMLRGQRDLWENEKKI